MKNCLKQSISLKFEESQLKSAKAEVFVKIFDEKNVATAAIKDVVSEDYTKASTSFFETYHFIRKVSYSRPSKKCKLVKKIYGKKAKNATQEL